MNIGIYIVRMTITLQLFTPWVWQLACKAVGARTPRYSTTNNYKLTLHMLVVQYSVCSTLTMVLHSLYIAHSKSNRIALWYMTVDYVSDQIVRHTC